MIGTEENADKRTMNARLIASSGEHDHGSGGHNDGDRHEQLGEALYNLDADDGSFCRQSFNSHR
ncbi:hypothetical protein ACFSE1_13585 [Rhizobium helianthi]|uniref:Uncharacterized protein n=1 Tax=Rhizobium helianthi TaxID=1132695 RepID=A0ABW4M4Z4_9HYPH